MTASNVTTAPRKAATVLTLLGLDVQELVSTLPHPAAAPARASEYDVLKLKLTQHYAKHVNLTFERSSALRFVAQRRRIFREFCRPPPSARCAVWLRPTAACGRHSTVCCLPVSRQRPSNEVFPRPAANSGSCCPAGRRRGGDPGAGQRAERAAATQSALRPGHPATRGPVSCLRCRMFVGVAVVAGTFMTCARLGAPAVSHVHVAVIPVPPVRIRGVPSPPP